MSRHHRNLSPKTMATSLTLAGLFALAPAMTGCGGEGSGPGFNLDSITSVRTGHQGTDNVLAGLRVGSKVANAAQDITPQQEYFIGRAVAADLLQRYPLLDNENATRYVNLVGQSVALYSDAAPFEGFRFAILDTQAINAFAAPGAYIFITTGMLRHVQSEDELAAVLAHEISHIQHRHAIGAIKSQRWTDAARAAGEEAASQAGGRDAQALRQAFGESVGDITQLLILKGYSRDQELSADRTAVTLLQRSGYDPAAMTRVLSRLQAVTQERSSLDLARSHPGAGDRVKALAGPIAQAASPAPAPQARQQRFNAALAGIVDVQN